MLPAMSSDVRKRSAISSLITRRLVEDLKGFSPQEQKQVLDVLQKANRLRLARIEAAIANARREITYPLPEEQINAPPGPWSTGPEPAPYVVDRNPDSPG
jgi:hypothetical protein